MGDNPISLEFGHRDIDLGMDYLRSELRSLEGRVARMVTMLMGMVEERDACIERLRSEISDLKAEIEMLNEKMEHFAG